MGIDFVNLVDTAMSRVGPTTISTFGRAGNNHDSNMNQNHCIAATLLGQTRSASPTSRHANVRNKVSQVKMCNKFVNYLAAPTTVLTLNAAITRSSSRI